MAERAAGTDFPSRVRIGAWRTPRNHVTVYFEGVDRDGLEHIACEWDTLPVAVLDSLHWVGNILPEVTRLISEYQECPDEPAMLVVLA